MTEYLIITAFLIWYILSLAVSHNIGKKSKLGVEGSFALSFLLSPIIGYLIAKFSLKK